MNTSTRMIGIKMLPRMVVILASWLVQPISRIAVSTLAITSAHITENVTSRRVLRSSGPG